MNLFWLLCYNKDTKLRTFFIFVSRCKDTNFLIPCKYFENNIFYFFKYSNPFPLNFLMNFSLVLPLCVVVSGVQRYTLFAHFLIPLHSFFTYFSFVLLSGWLPAKFKWNFFLILKYIKPNNKKLESIIKKEINLSKESDTI